MCDIEPLLYNTESPVKGVMWQRLLTCNMPAMLYAMLYDYCDMSSKQQESCANQALFLGSVTVVIGRQVAGTARQRHTSAADSLLWHARHDSGAAGTAEWPPALLQQTFGCGWTDSHHS